MDPTKLAELQNYFDNTDLSAEIEESTLDETVDPAPMVGITVRLPAAVLDKVREQAAEQGIKATALIREWVESSVAEQTDDDSTVRVSDLKKLFARATAAVTEQRRLPHAAASVIDAHPQQVAPEHPEQVLTVVAPVHKLKNFTVQISDLQISGVRHGDRLAPSDWHLISSVRHSTKRK